MNIRLLPALTTVAAVLFLASPASPALALDSMKGFALAPAPEQGKNVQPNTMTCREFVKANPDMQMVVSAWYDGNSSTFNPVPEAVYMHEDVVSMFDALIKGCQATPASTLEDLQFEYGGDGEPATPTCAMLGKMPNAQMASLLLAWTLGYVADDSDGDKTIPLDAFSKFGDAIFATCKGKPNANLLPLVMEYQGIKAAAPAPEAATGGKDIDN